MNQLLSSDERRSFVLERIKDRFGAFVSEMTWATGKADLPEAIRPPDWVKLAILRMSREMPLQLESIGGPMGVSPEDRGKIAGMARAGSLSMIFPTEQEKAEEENNPQLKRLRELFRPLANKMKRSESELAHAYPEVGEPKSPQEVEEYHEGGRKAAEFVSEDAEMSMKAELCFWMWMLWPDVEAVGSRAKVHEWIASMKFVSCSFKLFEKVCQEIGYCPGA
jgi:hypothetical protein